jgi:hypothetical protein
MVCGSGSSCVSWRVPLAPASCSAFVQVLPAPPARSKVSVRAPHCCSHYGSTDFNLMLLTEYKDLATYEKNLEKADALLQTVIGNDEKQRQGYRDRLEIREVLADRLAREIVL